MSIVLLLSLCVFLFVSRLDNKRLLLFFSLSLCVCLTLFVSAFHPHAHRFPCLSLSLTYPLLSVSFFRKAILDVAAVLAFFSLFEPLWGVLKALVRLGSRLGGCG